MASRYITMQAADGSGNFRGYMAMPSSGKGPGLVIAQEIFGVNKTMREVADRYADEGYVALVPDLFWRLQPDVELGYTPDDWQKAFGFFKGFNEAKGMEDLQTAISALRARPEVRGGGVGVLGFCLGGKLAYLASCRTDADVAVSYYGVGLEECLVEAQKIKTPLVLHIAELDKFSTPEARDKIVHALQGRPHISLHVYAGVDHAFARAGGDHYDRTAALLADERTNAALKAALGPHE